MKTIKLLLLLGCIALSASGQYRNGLDSSFGINGLSVKNIYPFSASGDDDRITDALFEPNGKILAIAGNSIVRLHAGGEPDSSFGLYGCVVDTFWAPDGSFYEVLPKRLALQRDGALIVVSVFNAAVWPMGVPQTLISRISSNGSIDRSFGILGSYTDSTLKGLYPCDIKLLSTGQIVVSGDSSYRPFLAMFLRDGFPDHSFGSGGRVVDLSGLAPRNAMIALDAHDRIIQLRQHYALARYRPDGQLDTGFNHTGKITSPVVPHAYTSMVTSTALAIGADESVWVAGNSFYNSSEPFSLMHVDSAGRTDVAFGSGGYAEYPWYTGKWNLVADMTLLRDGKLLLAGTVRNPTTGNDNFGLMRVHPDGRIDSSFGDKGRLITELEGMSVSPDRLYRVLEQADRKLLAFGTTSKGLSYIQSAIARYHRNGGTAVFEIQGQSVSLRVFPNPAGSLLHVESSTALPPGSSLSVYNLSGACMLHEAAAGLHEKSLSLSHLPAGNYLLTLQNEQQQVLFCGCFVKN